MLTDAEKEEKLAASPAPRVTAEYMQSRIEDVTFTRFTGTVTICNIKLDNGYLTAPENIHASWVVAALFRVQFPALDCMKLC